MISIILPAYNEEKNIRPAIKDISSFFKKNNLAYEIIAVNDGSQDKTAEVLEECRKTENIIVATHDKNLGYGAALRSGFNLAKGDLIFFTDSDRQFDIKDIIPFLEKINQADFVIGCRKNRKDFCYRKIYTLIFRFAAMIFFGVKVKDIDCAFKLFNGYVLSDLNLFSNGALINLEILAKAKKRNYKFFELPVNHFARKQGKPTGGSFKVVSNAIFQFFLLWLNMRSCKK